MTSYLTLLARIKTLQAQRLALDAQIITQAQVREKAEGIAQARALATEYGLSAADVFPPGSTKAAGSVGVTKYRDPATCAS